MSSRTLSLRAKEELAALQPRGRGEALAELSAIVQTAGSVNISGGAVTVSVVTDNSYMPSLLGRLSLTLMIPPPETSLSKHITLTFPGGRELLGRLGIFTGSMTRVAGIADGLVRKDGEKRCYMRGAFLGAGFLSAGRNNHMEMSFSGEKLRDDVAGLFPASAGPAGRGERGGRYTVYLKRKEKISDALVYMGATKAALELQEELLVSSIGSRAAAAQNCDVANIDRAVTAASRQLAAIDVIDEKAGLESLDSRLQTTALLRRAYPEANMGELAEILGVSTSCVKHRLEKLTAMADELAGGKQTGR